MEIPQHEVGKPSKIKVTVEDRIFAFHDRHLRVAPVAERMQQAFESVASAMTAKKGREAIDEIRPHVYALSRYAELGTASADIILSLLTGGFGVGEIVRRVKGSKTVNNNVAAIGESHTAVRDVTADRMNKRAAVRAGILGAAGGTIFAVRPVSRGTEAIYRYGQPLARKIGEIANSILLRKEQKADAHRIFVGSGKA